MSYEQLTAAVDLLATSNATLRQAASDTLVKADELLASFDVEEAGRTQAFYQYLNGLTLEVAVPYVAAIAVARPTQTVLKDGITYKPLPEFIPFTTTTWATDAAKFTTVTNEVTFNVQALTTIERKDEIR